MHQAMFFGRNQSLRDLLADIQHRGNWQRAVTANPRLERLALHQFHGIKTAAFRSLSEMKYGCDIRMPQLRCGARFAPEALPGLLILRVALANHLERHRATKVC